jgi:hypothetical protein
LWPSLIGNNTRGGREEEEEGGARFILANGYDFYPIETSFTQLSSTLLSRPGSFLTQGTALDCWLAQPSPYILWLELGLWKHQQPLSSSRARPNTFSYSSSSIYGTHTHTQDIIIDNQKIYQSG